MPFTPAHAAAALPFRRWLIPSALVVGTLAPDFEYFIRLTPGDRFGHTLLGTFVLTLPLALLVLWLFHSFVSHPVVMLLPDGIQRRLAPTPGGFRLLGPARFLLIVASVLLGIATHLLWDSFTHAHTWAYRRWFILRQTIHLPILGTLGWYKVLQLASSVVGIGILFGWCVAWYRTTAPSRPAIANPYSRQKKMAILVIVTAIALLGAIIRAFMGAGFSAAHLELKRFVGQAVVTFMALVWWQIVIYGLLLSDHRNLTRGDLLLRT